MDTYRKEQTSENTDLDEAGVAQVILAYSDEIKLYGEFLRDNDKKRDEFVRFYLSIVVSVTGFCVYLLVDRLKASSGLIDLSQPIFRLLALLLAVVFIIGLLTFHALIKFRTLHTYYVKLMNRNRGFKLQLLTNCYPSHAGNMARAWHEHIYDNFPVFLKTTGLEQALMRFNGVINSFVFGMIGVLALTEYLSRLFVAQRKWVGSAVFLIVSLTFFVIQWFWMRRTLSKHDTLYQAQITKLEESSRIKI